MGTTTTHPRRPDVTDPAPEQRSVRPTTGTATLVRLMLRRDRIKLPAWVGSHLAVVALGATLIMVVTGVLTGAAATAVTGDASLTGDSTVAHLNLVPAVLAVLGLAALLHGWLPGLLAPVGWAMVGLIVFAGTFATLLDVPQAVVNLSPLSHPAQVPVEDVALAPLLVLAALTIAGVALGLLGLRRRQVAGRS